MVNILYVSIAVIYKVKSDSRLLETEVGLEDENVSVAALCPQYTHLDAKDATKILN